MNEHEILDQLKQLIEAQLVVEESAEQFAFRHALTREAAYATLLRSERKALHHAVAACLENIYAAALDAHVGDLAYHYYEAGTWTKATFGLRRRVRGPEQPSLPGTLTFG